MLQVTGPCTNVEKAVEFFEMLPDNVPDDIKDDDFCEEYEEALNTFRHTASRLVPVVPKWHQGRSIDDYHTCGACGYNLNILFDYCPRCGRMIKWDTTRCLTGYPGKKRKGK